MSEVHALTCPNCGASVEITAAPGELVKCAYCGVALQLPETPHDETPPPVVINIPEVYTTPSYRGKQKTGAGVWLVMILPLIGLIIGLVAAFAPAVIAPQFYLWDAPIPLQGVENPNPDLIVQVRSYNDDMIRLALLDGNSRQLRWTSSQAFNSDSRSQPLAGGDFIYLTDKTTLYAFHVKDGSQAWQLSLPTEVDNSCKDCLRLVDGQLIVLNKDGTIQAFNPTSGTLVWSQSLPDSPRELMLAGGKPAVVSLDSDHNYGFYRFDPQTGAQTVIKNGLCQGKPDPKKNPPQRLEEVYLSPDGLLAYLMLYSSGFDQPGCAQLVDLATDVVQWSAVPQEGQTWPSAWFASEVAVTEEGVFFYEDNSLSMIDAKTGSLRELFKEPRYREVTPLVSTPGRIIALAVPDYDNDLKELWGIDLASGNRAWTFKMQARSIIDPWRVQLTPGGVVVVQCVRDSKNSTWDVLDPASGATLSSIKLSDQDYDFLEDTWTPTTAYLKLDSTLFSVSVKTGAVQYTWP